MMKKHLLIPIFMLILAVFLSSSGFAAAADWQTLTTVQGSASQTTDYIYVPSGEWRISWSYTATQYPESAVFAYTIKDVENKQTDFNMLTGVATTSGTSYLHEDGPGNYYFDITAANVQSYNIEIEYQLESHATVPPIMDELRGNSDFYYLLIGGIATVLFVVFVAVVLIKKRANKLPPPP